MRIPKQALLFSFLIINSLLTVCGQNSYAPDTTVQSAHIQVKLGIKRDRIHIRWAVDRASEWQKANSVGFTLKRYTVAKNGNVLDSPELKILGNFQPAPQSQWESVISTNDNAAIIAQSLYGESFEVDLGNSAQQGTIAQIVNKSQELEQRFAYALMAADMDFNAARLAGWGYTDTTVMEGERYFYLVELNANNNPNQSLLVENGGAIADLTMTEELPKPLDFMGIFQDKAVSLFWEYKQLEDIYSLYYIEKSDDGVNFAPLNNIPITNMTNSASMIYIDSLNNNTQEYSYRIRGKNIFGEYGPYSDIIKGRGVKKLEVSPHITSYDVLDEKNIVLKWDFPLESEKHIVGFELIHSKTDAKDSYNVIQTDIPANNRQITTQSISSANYFKIVAVGKSGDRRESFATMVQLNDTTPPAVPTNLKGEIDSTGVAKISWQPNTEIDLEGYHVFKSTQKGQEPVRITAQSVKTAFITDTVPLKSLNSKVYYYVLSVDKRKNESDFSKVLELEKPDVLAPQPPVFSDYIVKDGGITLKWIKSYSNDVVTHQLYRQALKGDDQNWYIVFQTNELKQAYSFTDKKLQEDIPYNYFLVAVDKTGLRSAPSKTITLRGTNTKVKRIISSLISFNNKDKKCVELNWKVKNADNVVEINVYRSVEESKPTLWGTLSGAQNFLEDKDVEEGKKYTYFLKVMLKSNKPTKMEKITVKYE